MKRNDRFNLIYIGEGGEEKRLAILRNEKATAMRICRKKGYKVISCEKATPEHCGFEAEIPHPNPCAY